MLNNKTKKKSNLKKHQEKLMQILQTHKPSHEIGITPYIKKTKKNNESKSPTHQC